MPNFLRLHCAELVCELQPDLGGCVSGLWLGLDAVLRSTPAGTLTSVRQSASYPLVPYSNRVGQAVLQWHGAAYPLVKNWPPAPHSIHGVGWERAWTVQASDAASATLTLAHRADAAWPFDFDATQTFQLEARAIQMGLSITNRSPVAAPVGLGWHPFFVKRSGAHLTFAATGRWDMGADQLPTQLGQHTGLADDVDQLEVDHCFDGWGGVVTLHDSVLRTTVTSGLRHLVAYTTPERDTVAIEPVSHVNNAFNLLAQGGYSADALGVRILQPGESMSCDMRIAVEHT